MQDIGSRPGHPAMTDIMWWHLFVSTWNGISMLWDSGTRVADLIVTSDASDSWGCGAYWEKA